MGNKRAMRHLFSDDPMAQQQREAKGYSADMVVQFQWGHLSPDGPPLYKLILVKDSTGG
jgi:hypothetical protein